MQLFVYITLVTLGYSIAFGDESALCKTWNEIEQNLRNENFLITCTLNNDCFGLNCSGSAQGYNISSKIQLYACDISPSIELGIDVPKLNIKNFTKRVYHNDSIALTDNLKLEFEIERKEEELLVGLFVHFVHNGSFPLLRIPRIPVISPTAFPIDCPVKKISEKPKSEAKSISAASSPPTQQPLVDKKGTEDEYSNCSIKNSTCDENEICKQTSKLKPDGVCICISNYTRNKDGICVYNQPPIDSSSVSLLLTSILVPVFVILILVAAVYFSIRFRVFQHLRRRLRVQVYEHVLLGEDEDEDEDLENPVA